MRYMHKKSEKLYDVMTEGVIQRSRISSAAQHVVNAWVEATLEVVPVFREVDGTQIALMRLPDPAKPFTMYTAAYVVEGETTRRTWLRPTAEFNDGRFARVLEG